MLCSYCGTDNEKGFRFCVKCGRNLQNPDDVNYEQVDKGHYHVSNELSQNSSDKYTLAVGTFTITDEAPRNSGSDLYTADELNESEEEFDFSIYEEPVVSSEPETSNDFWEQKQNNNYGQNVMPNQIYGNPSLNSQNGMGSINNPYINQMQGQPIMYSQPQIIGYDQSGSPIYGQPMIYGQPQIIGYDSTGSPIYAPPMMYSQPQIIGYDTNGNPVYGQPMMFTQPQIIGYDANGMPIYSQPPVMNTTEPPLQSPPYPKPVQNTPKTNSKTLSDLLDMPELPKPEPVKGEKKEKPAEKSDDFWNFFDNGKNKKHHEEDMDDFFGKSSRKNSEMGGVSIDEFDFNSLQRKEKKKNTYMNDTPLVNADDLKHNQADKISKMYMRQAENVNSSDLQAKKHEYSQDDFMDSTKRVDARMLSKNEHYKSRITMGGTESVNADDLQTYTREHKSALMASADHAVEAMPKKKSGYIDDLDKIELPAYMQARKTPKKDKKDSIPSIPDI